MRAKAKDMELKYLKFLKDLKAELERNPRTVLKEFCLGKINNAVVAQLRRGGIITNTGTKINTYYVWDTIEPNINMARELRNRTISRNKEEKKIVEIKSSTPKSAESVKTDLSKKEPIPVQPVIERAKVKEGIMVTISGDLSNAKTISIFIN